MYQMRQKTELKSVNLTCTEKSIYLCLLDIIIKIQATTYIKLRSTSTNAVRSRHNSEKETIVLEKYRKFERGELSRRDYVCILSYKFQPLI